VYARSVFSVNEFASAIRSFCASRLPGLESLLHAALALSVTQDEGRYSRIRIQTTYKNEGALYASLRLPLTELPAVAPSVSYPQNAILCAWRGKWQIRGVTKASAGIRDGVSIDITGPLCMSVTPPAHPVPTLEIVRGIVSYYDQTWLDVVSRVGKPSRRDSFILARAIFKVRMGGHGGTFLIVPSGSKKFLKDLVIRYRSRLGPWFDQRTRGGDGQLDSELVEEYSDVLAGLTGVDGAVVLKKDLSLIGFGATITSSFNAVDRSHGGHRHKSARAFCQENPGTVALVISQDGPITSCVGEAKTLKTRKSKKRVREELFETMKKRRAP
jgi:hypothetical protein